MKKIREIAGYVLGGLMFVLLIPTLMWLVSGRPSLSFEVVPVVKVVFSRSVLKHKDIYKIMSFGGVEGTKNMT